jgi:Holliday junction resolvase RusA-like endonuclease
VTIVSSRPSARIELCIPGPPVPKQRARAGAGGKFYTPEPTVAWAKHARSCANAAVLQAGWRRPLAGAVEVTAIVVAPDHRPRDLDNTAGKALCDALNGVVWYDDRQVTRTDHVKAMDKDAPGIYVAICALDSWDDPTVSDVPVAPDKRSAVCGWGRSPEHRVWLNMIARCTHEHHKAWANYGGRGIRVCDEWLGHAGWWRFLLHVGGRPGAGYDLDRIDNDGHYEPGNVRWATRETNTRNKRTNVRLDVGGESLAMSEAAQRAGISSACLSWRLRAGWTIEAAMQPDDQRRKRAVKRRPSEGEAEQTIVTVERLEGER